MAGEGPLGINPMLDGFLSRRCRGRTGSMNCPPTTRPMPCARPRRTGSVCRRKVVTPWVEAALLLLAALLAGAVTSPVSAGGGPPHNVLLVVLDDFGFNDLGINSVNALTTGADAPTPVLDEFARNGVRFTRHYTESTCEIGRAHV